MKGQQTDEVQIQLVLLSTTKSMESPRPRCCTRVIVKTSISSFSREKTTKLIYSFA